MKLLPAPLLLAFCLLISWPASWAQKIGNPAPPPPARKVYKLKADQYWRVNPPGAERFDASGLLLHRDNLFVVNDRTPGLFSMRLGDKNEASLAATPWFQFGPAQGQTKGKPFDFEGIASDSAGRLYLCEESARAIYRQSPGGKPERLEIDWSPVQKFFKGGANSSFEGIAVGGGRIWVANEREQPRIIAVNLQTLKVELDFAVRPLGFAFGGPHYSDLSWHEDSLFVLDRNHRLILEVDPEKHTVVAEYDFASIELQEHFAYKVLYPTGTMEGLAIDADFFWLVTDNNGLARLKASADVRPTLFRCRRPQPNSSLGDRVRNGVSQTE